MTGNKMYTMEDAQNLKTDLDVLHLPRTILCDSKETKELIMKRLAEMHISAFTQKNSLRITT